MTANVMIFIVITSLVHRQGGLTGRFDIDDNAISGNSNKKPAKSPIHSFVAPAQASLCDTLIPMIDRYVEAVRAALGGYR